MEVASVCIRRVVEQASERGAKGIASFGYLDAMLESLWMFASRSSRTEQHHM